MVDHHPVVAVTGNTATVQCACGDIRRVTAPNGHSPHKAAARAFTDHLRTLDTHDDQDGEGA